MINKLPKKLMTVLALYALYLVWMWWHGFPMSTSDTVAFKQPAYMRLFTPNFSIPSYAGRCPSYELLNSYPACIYTYLNYVVFRWFGFGLFQSLAVDLTIHFLLSSIATWLLWKITASEWLTSLFVISTASLIMPIGRPEELGMLFVVLALAGIGPQTWRYIAAAILLGLAGATSPGSAIVGTALVVSYQAFRSQFSKSFVTWATALCLLAPMISAVIYIGYVWPYLKEAIEQHHFLSTTKFYATITAGDLFRFAPSTCATFVTLATITVGIGGIGVFIRPSWFPANSAKGCFISAASVTIPIAIGINLFLGRLIYDYRHVGCLIAAAMLAICSLIPIERTFNTAKLVFFASSLVVIGFTLMPARDLARFSLASLTWSAESPTFSQSMDTVHRLIPKDASLGGDGATWAVATDGRPFMAIRTVAPDFWPDYIVSSTWSSPPTVLQLRRDHQRIESLYEEITPAPILPQDGCTIQLLKWRVPLAKGRGDWYMRIWKRRAAVNQAAKAQSPE